MWQLAEVSPDTFPTHSVVSESNKQFEEFAKKWNYDLSIDEAGFYMNSLTQRLWDCWEESRRENK
jgi:hypothetical protein